LQAKRTQLTSSSRLIGTDSGWPLCLVGYAVRNMLPNTVVGPSGSLWLAGITDVQPPSSSTSSK